MNLTRRNRTLNFVVDLNLTAKAYDKIYALAEGVVIHMKGQVDMADPTPRWHELAQAGVALYRKDNNVVPRGTARRDETVGGRLSRPWPPHQRVSWMAELLPFVGQEDLARRIDRKKSWRDEENLKHGLVLVPQFLNPAYPRTSWRALVPSLGVRDQAATHVAGVAGVGLDAADYDPRNPDQAKKMGIFGYDRQTSLKDVTDGAANTIYMIQVPPDLPRPWIAGGGATVVGIREQDGLRPFITPTTTRANGGKAGVHVIMADGSVRFIRAGVSDEVLKALATIKGGEAVSDLNAVAPKVDPPKRTELRTASTGGGASAVD
jgi:hypothetical protein